eukprot:3762728-Prymnesium_polylepis.1
MASDGTNGSLSGTVDATVKGQIVTAICAWLVDTSSLTTEEITCNTSLRELGLDSLSGLELIEKIRASTDSPSLPASLVFSCDCVKDLVSVMEHWKVQA